MGKYEKLLNEILRGKSDASVSLDDLRHLLRRLGFAERTHGSHHIFRKAGVDEKINLQREGSKAKAYQERQVRIVILKHKLAVE